YANPHTLIAVRLVSRDARHPFAPSLIRHRLKVALALRERLYDAPFYRAVFAESDGLPGLVVDRYGEVLAVQVTTAGMERMSEVILDALERALRPAGIWLRNDTAQRELEGLECYSRCARGECPESVVIREGTLEFEVPVAGGQKTGWFYDQRDNRRELGRYVQGARVLDVFSYLGGWGLQAVAQGAAQAICVDASERAIDGVLANARRNGLEDRIGVIEDNAFEALRGLRDEGERFDVVIVDPPAFIKRRKDVKNGLAAYRRINELAMRLIDRDGFLVSCSCSHHLREEALVEQLWGAARHIDRRMQILARGGQSADHPVHPAIPETAYLKAVFARIHR
ncbi:MAG: class I SAM-dependent rRNA methyltransferase, partial [Gammaproteobacteria bacterium]